MNVGITVGNRLKSALLPKMKVLLLLLVVVCVAIHRASAAGAATDKANVKLVACSKAQTVSKTDKATLAKNSFTKCAEPFGILVAGSKGMTDATVLETAKILAELLDQNRDGVVDDSNVLAKLKCGIWMVCHSAAISFSLGDRTNYFEVDKFWYQDGVSQDTAARQRLVRVEEVHHAITQIGYGSAYPAAFATNSWTTKSTLVNECKKARCDWWMHPENKCLNKKKLPLLKDNFKCMKTYASRPGEVYPGNDGVKCTKSKNKQTCNYPSCDCIEWYHQVALILAGQKPAWIANMRNQAGLKGDKVMPTTKKAMIKLLKKKNKPLLKLWQNKKYNQLKKPLKYNYPIVKGTAPTLTACASSISTGGGDGDYGGDDFDY